MEQSSSGGSMEQSSSEASVTQTTTVKLTTRLPTTQTTSTMLSTITSSPEDSQNVVENFTPSAPQTSTKPPRFEERPSPEKPHYQTQPTTDITVDSEVNIPDGNIDPLLPPSLSTQPPPPSTPPTVTDPPYSVSPTSIYPCTQPGYYEEVTSCKQFYVCREVGPGVLSADRIFRCPDRYLFDIKTHLCQREQKVTCKNQPSLFYTVLNYMVVQLKEEQMEQFFKQSLTLPEYRGRTGIIQELPLPNYRARTGINQELPLFYNFHSPPHLLVYH